MTSIDVVLINTKLNAKNYVKLCAVFGKNSQTRGMTKSKTRLEPTQYAFIHTITM